LADPLTAQQGLVSGRLQNQWQKTGSQVSVVILEAFSFSKELSFPGILLFAPFGPKV
jgi:hypothetical protein